MGWQSLQHRGPCTSLQDTEYVFNTFLWAFLLFARMLFCFHVTGKLQPEKREDSQQGFPTVIAKSKPSVTWLLAPDISGKPNMQILSWNNTTFRCFLPDDRNDLIIASEPAVLIKLKSHVACSKIGWLRLKHNTLSSAAEIRALCLAEESEETHSFLNLNFTLDVIWLLQNLEVINYFVTPSFFFFFFPPYLLGSEVHLSAWSWLML